MLEFKLPSLGADMDEGKLLEWKVRPGDRVRRGQVVALVDTAKAAVDVEIWHEGIVHRLMVQPGETVPVGTVLATLMAADEATPGGAPGEAAAPALPRRPVTPAARRRARELGADIDSVTGTGPGGAVLLEDVDRAAARGAPRDKSADMRKAIAAAMSRSKREIPHYYLSHTIPLERATAWLQAENARRPVTARLLMASLLIKAVALACAKYPEMNGWFGDERHQPSAAVHVGVAIALRQGGLIAPAIHDVERKSLDELMQALADLVQRARAGSLRSSEMSDPTITVTNLGDQGVEAVFGVIYPRQVALVGFGQVRESAWIKAGALCAMPVVGASLAADHRVSDGHRGALFLRHIDELLQQPQQL